MCGERELLRRHQHDHQTSQDGSRQRLLPPRRHLRPRPLPIKGLGGKSPRRASRAAPLRLGPTRPKPPHPSESLRIACTGIPGSQDAEPGPRSRSCSTRRRLTQLRETPDTMGHEALPRLGPERSSLHDATVTLRIPPHSYVRRSPAAVERCGPARARVRGLPGDQALPAPAAAVGDNRSPACGAVRPAGRRAPRGPGRGARSRTRPVREPPCSTPPSARAPALNEDLVVTPNEFITKWRASELKERSASQEHFIDLCRLLGEPTPAAADPTGETYCFERGPPRGTRRRRCGGCERGSASR